MNANGAHDLEETRTRRSLLATAGGLLLPAGLLVTDMDDVEATREARRRRQRRRDKPGMFANDVIVNFRNATDSTRVYRLRGLSEQGWRSLEPGQESGFATGITPYKLTTSMDVVLPEPGEDIGHYIVTCSNAEIGSPSVDIVWIPSYTQSDRVWVVDDIAMGEDTTLEAFHRGYRFHVHRWTNGKEALDDYDEWYTRFFVTMSNA
jgi:hypothetical protein